MATPTVAHTATWQPPADLDPECRALCVALNQLPGIRTTGSCWMAPMGFLLEGPPGAYADADSIARHLTDFLQREDGN
jgi:hypothetical protein